MTAPHTQCQPDIVERLRTLAHYLPGQRSAFNEAADRIEELAKALAMQEAAEEAHANCSECEGEEVPELCPKCFPLFDDARIARRSALSSEASDV